MSSLKCISQAETRAAEGSIRETFASCAIVVDVSGLPHRQEYDHLHLALHERRRVSSTTFQTSQGTARSIMLIMSVKTQRRKF